MLRIPSHPYDGAQNRDVVVDPSEGSVSFAVEVKPVDVTGHRGSRSVAEQVDEILKTLDQDPGARLVSDLSDEEMNALLGEIRILRTRLEEFVSVDLYLDPDRARAIAAGLVYAAHEIEEGRA